MSEIDTNGPHVEFILDTDSIETDLYNLDKYFDNLMNNWSYSLLEFQQLFQKVTHEMQKDLEGVLQGEPRFTSFKPEESRSFSKEEKISFERTQEDYKTRQLEYERLRLDQGRKQIEETKELKLAVKDIGTAVARVVMGGMGIAAMFDFAHQTNRLEMFLKSNNINPVQGMLWKNILNQKGIEDTEVWQTLSSVAKTGRDLQWPDPKFWISKQGHAYSVLSTFDPYLTAVRDSKGNLITPEQRLLMLKNAAEKLGKDQSHLYTDEIKTDIVTNALGSNGNGDRNIATLFLKGDISDKVFQKKSPEYKKSLEMVAQFPKLKKADAAYQDLKNTFSVNMAKAIANITPVAVEFMKTLDGFLSKQGELVATAAALLTISTAFRGIFKTLAFFLGGPKLFSTFLETVGLRVLGPPAIALALGGDTNETPEQKEAKIKTFKKYQAQAKVKAEQALTVNAEKVREIEQATGGTLQFSPLENRLILVDKNGNYILYVDDLNVTADKIIQKAKSAQAPSMWNPLNWFLPSAHAETVTYSPEIYRRNKKDVQWNMGVGASMKEKQKYLEALEDQYDLPRGSLDAQWLQESSRGRYMLSKASAQGDFGFMAATAKEYGVNAHDFYSSAQGAARYMSDLKKKYHGNMDKAYAAYNAGPGKVDKISSIHGTEWVRYLPRETQGYLENVSKNTMIYQRQQATVQAMPLHQMQAQYKTQQILNHNRYREGNQTNNVTVNVASGDPHLIGKIVKQNLNELNRKKAALDFPKMNQMGAIRGGI